MTAACSSTPPCIPAVPPGGALLRTSVMATHDEPTIDRALSVFARVKREFEAEHGPLPAPADAERANPRVTFLTRLNPRSGLVQFFTSGSGNEKGRC